MTVRQAEHRAAVERRLDVLDEAMHHAGEQLIALRSAMGEVERALYVVQQQSRMARAANAGDREAPP